MPRNEDDTDKMEIAPSSGSVPKLSASDTAGLPVAEPSTPLTEQHAELTRRLQELENDFRFMGTKHPQYATMRVQVERLQKMLAQLEQQLGK